MDGYNIKRVHSWDLKATVQRAVQETESRLPRTNIATPYWPNSTSKGNA